MPPPPSYLAHNCAVLAVDPGASSGWSLFLRGKRGSSGACADNRQNRDDIVSAAARIAIQHHLPLVGVVETWNHHGKWNDAAMIGVAESSGRWIDSFHHFGVCRIVRAEPGQWRTVMGGQKSGNRGTKEWKQAAIQRAFQEWKQLMDADQAEACMIGLWGSRAGAVGDAMARRLKLEKHPLLIHEGGGTIEGLAEFAGMDPDEFWDCLDDKRHDPISKASKASRAALRQAMVEMLDDPQGRVVAIVGRHLATIAGLGAEVPLMAWHHDPLRAHTHIVIPAPRGAWWKENGQRGASILRAIVNNNRAAEILLHRRALPAAALVA